MWFPSLNRVDISIMHWLNSLVGKSVYFDQGIMWLYYVNFIKGAIFVSIFWWYWFRKTDAATTQRTREHVLSTLCAAIVAIVVARILALSLPFRVRPRFEPMLQHFVLPAGATPNDMINWSGFPSDHSTMFAALAGGLWFISRPMGVLAMLYTIFIISFPRVYLGAHYPFDVLVGVILGAALSYCLNLTAVRRHIAGPALRLEQTSPGAFYVALFLLSFEFSTMFESLQKLAVAIVHFFTR
jgi:undecaprenyl-diphosphatase